MSLFGIKGKAEKISEATRLVIDAENLIDRTEAVFHQQSRNNVEPDNIERDRVYQEAGNLVRRIEVDGILDGTPAKLIFYRLRSKYGVRDVPDYIFGQRANNSSRYGIGARARRKTKENPII